VETSEAPKRVKGPKKLWATPDGLLMDLNSKAVRYDKFYRDVLLYWHGETLIEDVDTGKTRVPSALVTLFDPNNPLGAEPLQPGAASPICAKCKLFETGCKSPFMQPVGSETPLVTIICDSVTKNEDAKGQISIDGFPGWIAKIIHACREETGVSLDDIRWFPLTRCANAGKAKVDYKIKGNWCRYHLVDDLMRHPPKLIIPVGTASLGMLCHKSNAQDWQGKLLTYRGWPDDWLTDKRFVLPRPHPVDATKQITGHPVFGEVPSVRIPMMPIQSPRLVLLAMNKVVTARWKQILVNAMKLVKEGVKPKVYTRPWYRFTTDPDVAAEGLCEIINNPGMLLCYDTETTGLKPWSFHKLCTTKLPTPPAIVSMMFRWSDPKTGNSRSIGFPWDYEASPMKPYLKILGPLVYEALTKSKLIGHNLTFDVLYTFATLYQKWLVGWDNPEFNKKRDRWLCALADAAKFDTWHAAYTYMQRVGSLGLEIIAYDWAPELAGYEEDMVLLIELHKEAMHPGENKGGHYLNCDKKYWPTHVIPYVMGDVESCFLASGRLREKLKSTEGRRYNIPLARPGSPGRFRFYTPLSRAFVYESIMVPAAAVLMKIMGRGMTVDLKKLNQMETALPKTISDLRTKLKQETPAIGQWCEEQASLTPGWELDLENKGHLKDLLFNVLNLPVQRFTKNGKKFYGEDEKAWSENIESAVKKRFPDLAEVELTKKIREEWLEFAATDKFTLNRMAVDHESVRPLQDYRKVYKLYSTYVRPLRNITVVGLDKKARVKDPHLCSDACIHASFLMTGTRGGRLCVSGDTRLEVRVDGVKKVVVISDLWKHINQHVTVKTHCGRWQRIKRLYFKGYERMFEATTESGGTVKATAEHRVFSERGWQSLGVVAGQKLKLFVDLASATRTGFERTKFSEVGATKTNEFSADERNDFKACGFTELAGLPSVESGTSTVASGAFGRCSEGQRKWSENAVSSAARGQIGGFDQPWNTHRAHREGDENNAFFSRTEHSGVWVAEIGQRAGSCQSSDRVSTEADRSSVSGVDNIFCELFYGQGEFFPKSLSSVHESFAAGLVFEGYVSDAVYTIEGGQRWYGGNFVVDEPPRVGTVSRAIVFEYSELSGVRIQWEQTSRLWADWHEHPDRSGRRLPCRGSRQSQYKHSRAFRLSSTALHNTPSPIQNVGGDCRNTGRFEAVIQWRSVGVQAVWDIEVEGDHSYLAQGLFHHNSCRDPNLQQLPRDGEVKSLYISRFGKRGCMYQGDLSQVELRLMASACGDPTMVKAYFDETDLHTLTTSRIFNTPYEHFSKDYMKWLQERHRDKEAKELSQKRNIGKCVDPSTLVSVNGRITRIGDIHAGREEDTFYPMSGRHVQTPNGTQEIREFYCSGIKERVLVCSLHGIISCSPNHRFQLADGSLIQASLLKKGMLLADGQSLVCEHVKAGVFFDPFGTSPKSNVFQINITPDLAYVLGLFYGDGCSNLGEVSICTGGTPEFFEWQDIIADSVRRAGFYPKIDRTVWSSEVSGPKVIKTGPTVGQEINGAYGLVNFGCTRVSDLFIQLGAVDETRFRRRTLTLPEWMFNAPDDVKLEFIAGVLDTDGYVKKDGSASICTKSWRFAQDLMVLVGTLGIACTVAPDWNKTYERYYFIVRFARRDSHLFADKLRNPGKRGRIKPVVFRYSKRVKNRVTLVMEQEPSMLVEIAIDSPHLYTPEGLTTHQTVNFLTGYGGGAFGLQNVLAAKSIYLSIEQCEAIIESFFASYPALQRFLMYYKQFIVEQHVAVSIFGRVRVFEEVQGDDQEAKAKALRAGCNHVIQSTASDMMLLALVAIEDMMKEADLESILVSTVHDSLLVDCVQSELPVVHDIVTTVLNNFPTVLPALLGADFDTSWLLVPFTGDCEVGLDYLSAKSIPKDNIDWDKLLYPSNE